MKFITRIGSKVQHEYDKKLRKNDLPFLKRSTWPYAACIVICVSLEDKQHQSAAGTFMNSGKFARICLLNLGDREEQNIQD